MRLRSLLTNNQSVTKGLMGASLHAREGLTQINMTAMADASTVMTTPGTVARRSLRLLVTATMAPFNTVFAAAMTIIRVAVRESVSPF